ncbi:peroxiredoxin-5, mitochondrial-like [Branchiostoma floridae]|uniref:Peroxiredoxin-5 n=1 Tax=Branchiostoma floridae TaxID=7739 RepID=A0A9J7M7F5_BRAFL|nr:peroxiredoxin-5, mitochondrial-like [Branchiostoma floridae]
MMLIPVALGSVTHRLPSAIGALRTIFTATAYSMPIKVGDKLPGVDLYENTPGNKVNVSELFAGKKGVIFAVPGAFTPGCSKTHLPGFVSRAGDLQAKGVQVIACVSVNDPFVMEAWGRDQKAEGKVRMLADTGAEFTKAIGLDLDATAILGNIRSKRYSMLVEDGEVKQLNVEPDGTGLSCSLAEELKL